MMTSTRFWASVIAGSLAVACADDAAPPQPTGVELAPIASFTDAAWTGARSADDPVIATVEGTPITQSMLVRELALRGDGADPRAVLEDIIEFELLARKAFDAGLYTKDVVGRPVAQALARRLIDEDMNQKMSPADIPAEAVEQAYGMVRTRYQHFEVFSIVDAQVLCCPAETPDACYKDLFDNVEERRTHVADCFRTVKPMWESLRARVQRAKTKEEFRLLVDSAFLDLPPSEAKLMFQLDPKLHEYDFQYDVETSYETQFETIRYQVFYKEIMDGAKETWFGTGRQTPAVSPVLQSPLGLHLLFIGDVRPRKNQPVTDPAVQAELRERMFPQFRTAKFQELTGKLCEAASCQLVTDNLIPLQNQAP